MRSRGCQLSITAAIIAFAMIFAFGTTRVTASGPQDESIIALIELLKEKGVISEEEAQRFAERIQEIPEKSAPEEERVITIIPAEKEDEYIDRISKKVARTIESEVKEDVKEEIRFEIAKEDREMGRDRSVPDWVRRIKWGGDIRLRYQKDFYDENNALQVQPDDWSSLMNTREDRKRFRYRVRLAMKAEVNRQTEVGIRLATGNEDDPVSTNDTFGDMFNKDSVTFDQAYIKYAPIQELEVWGGRIPNPYFFTDLVWDKDVNLEGLAVKADVPFAKEFSAFMTLGAYPLEEVEMSSDDKWLYAGQVGARYKPRSDLTYTLGVAYYDYDNVTGKLNDPSQPGLKDYTAPSFMQKGNSLFDIDPVAGSTLPALASEFEMLNITGTLDIARFYPIHVILTADYVKNLGFDKDDIARRQGRDPSDLPDTDVGYQVGLTVGHGKVSKLGQWQAYLFYKHLEADAVFDAFTDSDFHGGGTDAEGWILGGAVGIGNNLWLTGKWISADEIDGPPLAIDTFQIDMNAKF